MQNLKILRIQPSRLAWSYARTHGACALCIFCVLSSTFHFFVVNSVIIKDINKWKMRGRCTKMSGRCTVTQFFSDNEQKVPKMFC